MQKRTHFNLFCDPCRDFHSNQVARSYMISATAAQIVNGGNQYNCMFELTAGFPQKKKWFSVKTFVSGYLGYAG